MKETDKKSKYYHTICNFQKYFQKKDPQVNFIDSLKENMKMYAELKEEGIVENKKYYLHSKTTNYICYPENPVNLEEKNKSILLVIHELSRTGAPVVCLDTAKALIKNGYFVTVISLIEGPLLEELLQIGVSVVIMKELTYFQHVHQEICTFVNNLDLDIFVQSFDKTIMITATLYNCIKRYINTKYNIIWWLHEGSVSYDILGYSMPRYLSENIKGYVEENMH